MTNLVMLGQVADTTNTEANQAIDLCTRCGECEAACGVDQPVVDILDAARTRHQAPPAPWQAPSIEGAGSHIAIVCSPEDWTASLKEAVDIDLASLHTHDHLGELHRIRKDTKAEVHASLRELIGDKVAICTCLTCLTALMAAGCEAIHLASFLDTQQKLPQWRTCQCSPGPGIRTMVTCCGARAPLITSHPNIANMVAEDLHRRLDGQAVYIEDTRCSTHLKAVGTQVVDPIDRLKNMEIPNANR